MRKPPEDGPTDVLFRRHEDRAALPLLAGHAYGMAMAVAPYEQAILHLQNRVVGAYRERNVVASVLAGMFDGVIMVGADARFPDWAVVYIDFPTGQISFHVAPEDFDLFEHIPEVSVCPWDGHTKDEAIQRILAFNGFPKMVFAGPVGDIDEMTSNAVAVIKRIITERPVQHSDGSPHQEEDCNCVPLSEDAVQAVLRKSMAEAHCETVFAGDQPILVRLSDDEEPDPAKDCCA